MSTRKEIALVLTSLIMIGAAFVVNPLTFRYLLGNDITSTTGNVLVWILDLLFVGFGLFVFLKRKVISGRRAFSGFAYILSLLVFIEVVLQAVAAFSPKMNFILSQLSPIVEDERLGYRPSAFHPEHDANGFRNASIPKAADIVAMGDSQTYGNNAARDEAWPQQLSHQSGLISYNMAFGGYSPVHSIILLKEAFSLHPKVIINGVYSGNDLEEAYWFVYLQDKLSKMKSTDVQLVNELAELEASTPSGFTKREFEQEDLKISIKTANFLKAILRLIVLKFETMDKHWELYKKSCLKRPIYP